MSQNPKVQEIIVKSVQYLTDRNFVDNPRYESEILLCEVMGCRRIELYLKYDKPLQDNELEKMRLLLKRRGTGEPIAYILGRKGFFKHDFKVTPDTLIPRPETEVLVEEVINRCDPNSSYEILDLGCGSGAIGLSLAANLEQVRVTLLDVSGKSLQVAQENAKQFQVSERCQFIEADMMRFSFATKKFDIVVGNPPYIDKNDPQVESWVKQFEPHIALFAANQGMELLYQCINIAKETLSLNGWAIFEHGYEQGGLVKKYFLDNEFKNCEAIKDLNSHWRHTLAFK
jgi:release factor glutamine methyltransferase